MATKRSLQTRSAARCALIAFLATLFFASPPAQASYGWPVKPFDQQHPVRGFFGDPRIASHGEAPGRFHFGIDISAPNGAPVYATLSGIAYVEPEHPNAVGISAGARSFGYWHITPAIENETPVVAYRTVIGHVQEPWAHVHLAELIDGEYVNPLRVGGVAPYLDQTLPTIRNIVVERAGSPLGRSVAGRIDLVADVFDDTPLTVPGAWAGRPVTPALVRWRLRGPNVASNGWRGAVDFRATIPAASLFAAYYARWTRQNHASVRGRYRVYLAHRLDTATLPDGRYRIEVVAADTRGNVARASVAFRIANQTPIAAQGRVSGLTDAP